MSNSRYYCADHRRFTAGCVECQELIRDAQRALRSGAHFLRSAADEAYAAGMVELLAQREIHTGRLSIVCSELLAEHAGRPV